MSYSNDIDLVTVKSSDLPLLPRVKLFFLFLRAGFRDSYFFDLFFRIKAILIAVFSSPRQLFYFLAICFMAIFMNFGMFIRNLFFLSMIVFSASFFLNLVFN